MKLNFGALDANDILDCQWLLYLILTKRKRNFIGIHDSAYSVLKLKVYIVYM